MSAKKKQEPFDEDKGVTERLVIVFATRRNFERWARDLAEQSVKAGADVHLRQGFLRVDNVAYTSCAHPRHARGLKGNSYLNLDIPLTSELIDVIAQEELCREELNV